MQNIAVMKKFWCVLPCVKMQNVAVMKKVWFVLPCVKMQNVAVIKKIGLFCHILNVISL